MTQISGCKPKTTVTEFDNTETQASLSLPLPLTYSNLLIPTLAMMEALQKRPSFPPNRIRRQKNTSSFLCRCVLVVILRYLSK